MFLFAPPFSGGARVTHGKHVVLNQNPRLQYLFDNSGRCWNFRSDLVTRLLGEVRRELVNCAGRAPTFTPGVMKPIPSAPRSAVRFAPI